MTYISALYTCISIVRSALRELCCNVADQMMVVVFVVEYAYAYARHARVLQWMCKPAGITLIGILNIMSADIFFSIYTSITVWQTTSLPLAPYTHIGIGTHYTVCDEKWIKKNKTVALHCTAQTSNIYVFPFIAVFFIFLLQLYFHIISNDRRKGFYNMCIAYFFPMVFIVQKQNNNKNWVYFIKIWRHVLLWKKIDSLHMHTYILCVLDRVKIRTIDYYLFV